MCIKAVLPAYPAQQQAEDTPVVQHIVEHGRIAVLDLPQPYMYMFHSYNIFAAEHWEKHWLMATESFEGPLFEAVVQVLQERLQLTLLPESTSK